ncbi:hypothetical protein MMC26_005419 [Xylographa opegraphella]|nr:hypothetical protein [Xylographa opegraphella]
MSRSGEAWRDTSVERSLTSSQAYPAGALDLNSTTSKAAHIQVKRGRRMEQPMTSGDGRQSGIALCGYGDEKKVNDPGSRQARPVSRYILTSAASQVQASSGRRTAAVGHSSPVRASSIDSETAIDRFGPVGLGGGRVTVGLVDVTTSEWTVPNAGTSRERLQDELAGVEDGITVHFCIRAIEPLSS